MAQLNTGNKYHGNMGVLKMDVAGGTAETMAHTVSWNAADVLAEIDGNELGSAWANRDKGLEEFEFSAVVVKSSAAAILRSGEYDVELVMDPQTTTDGKIAGQFLCQVRYRGTFNQYVVYDVSGKSQGAVTVTNPVA